MYPDERPIGGDDGNRTRVSSLEGWGNSHYTTSPQITSVPAKTTRENLGYKNFEVARKMVQELFVLKSTVELPRDVAQLGSARALGARCRRFKSCHPDQ